MLNAKCDAGQLYRVLRHNFGRNLLFTQSSDNEIFITGKYPR